MKLFKTFALAMAGLTCVLPACENKENGKKEEKTISTDVVSNTAKFQFDEETYNFGKVTAGEKVSYGFKFKNTGNTDLVITSASGSCGCTVPEWPKEPIGPGKEGVINVIFDSEGRSGLQHKQVTIVANTNPNTVVLHIEGEVIAADKSNPSSH